MTHDGYVMLVRIELRGSKELFKKVTIALFSSLQCLKFFERLRLSVRSCKNFVKHTNKIISGEKKLICYLPVNINSFVIS